MGLIGLIFDLDSIVEYQMTKEDVRFYAILSQSVCEHCLFWL
jgi:hypothetical protein